MSQKRWNPELEPYRVRYIHETGGYGLYGWFDRTETVQTELEAINKMEAPMPAGCYEVQVALAEIVNGKHVGWKRVASRKRTRGSRKRNSA